MGDYSLTESLGTLLFVFGGGVTVGWLIVSHFMKDELQTVAQDEQDTREESKDYERSYYNEFEALEEKDHGEDFLKELGNMWTIEDTPYGEIIMTYKADNEAFWYYSERRNVPYRILDAVARRFAIDNDCKSVCVNYKEEFEKGKNAVVAAKEVSAKSPVSGGSTRKKKPLATFKSYNMKKGNYHDRKYIITENANRFTYKGNTTEWQDPNEASCMKGDAPLTYADFKRGYRTNDEVHEETISESQDMPVTTNAITQSKSKND